MVSGVSYMRSFPCIIIHAKTLLVQYYPPPLPAPKHTTFGVLSQYHTVEMSWKPTRPRGPSPDLLKREDLLSLEALTLAPRCINKQIPI